MKKIISILVMLVCCMFVFSACGEKKEYNLTTSEILTNFYQSDTYAGMENVEFSDNIQEISSKSYGRLYAELDDIYTMLFNSSMSLGNSLRMSFAITPNNQNSKTKSSFKTVNKSVEELIKNIELFKTQKTEFESFITSIENEVVMSNVAKARLLEMKRVYLDLIESAHKFSTSVYNAYITGYFGLSDFSDTELELTDLELKMSCKLAIFSTNLNITDTAIKVLKDFRALESRSFYNRYWQATSEFYSNCVVGINEKVIATDIIAKLNQWQNVNDSYLIELETLDNVLDKIDVVELANDYDFNAIEYGEAKGDDKYRIYANYFINFYQKVDFLKGYSYNLLQSGE